MLLTPAAPTAAVVEYQEAAVDHRSRRALSELRDALAPPGIAASVLGSLRGLLVPIPRPFSGMRSDAVRGLFPHTGGI